jgi:hypothetical protein
VHGDTGSQLLKVQERKTRLMGLDAPTRRAVDVITHDALMEAIADMEADIARKEAQLASRRLRDAALEAGDLG